MNINNQLQFVYDTLKFDADNKKINLSFKCALPEKEATIKTDSDKFYRILTNLVKNAIKFTDTGTIEFGYVSTGPTTLAVGELVEPAHLLEFFVKDTGIGIAKDRQEAIFERFIQAEIEDKMARQGAGLGLSISKAYVEMLGGRIWVESAEGIGSTFYFTIPCNAITSEIPVKKNLTSDQDDIPQLELFKVLVVEDDETSEALIIELLNELSKEILTAKNGHEAVKLCRQHPDIDLVLMDIQMPKLNGYDATQQIRQFNKDVVIIAQTAFALTGDWEKAIKAGCNDYIAKPIKKAELLWLIQKHF
jgi:hypothetical protein